MTWDWIFRMIRMRRRDCQALQNEANRRRGAWDGAGGGETMVGRSATVNLRVLMSGQPQLFPNPEHGAVHAPTPGGSAPSTTRQAIVSGNSTGRSAPVWLARV